MKKSNYKIFLFLIFHFLLTIKSTKATDIQFNINMHYEVSQGLFNPGTDQVGVVGSFSSIAINMSDPDGDNIYTALITGFIADAEITYNFSITHSSVTSNENITARKYVVQSFSNANILYNWFNDQMPDYPYAKFFASASKAIPGEVVRYFEESEGAVASSWNWSFQGGTPASSSVKNPTVVYSSPGKYTVSLNVSDAKGSTTAKTFTINVTAVDSVLGWWNDQVFYEIYPWSFLDTDGNGKGDLRGIINKLDYLNDGNPNTSTDLGVTALYIMPIHPATNANYGGYEVTDYKAIFTQLGTQADFDELVSKAHNRGMKVIMDMVFNHSSTSHPWFQAARTGTSSKYEEYYVFNKFNSVNSWGWRNNPSSANPNFNYYWSQFTANSTADFNLRSLSVKNSMKDISSFWLNKNIDGFRIDAPIYFYGAEDGGTNVDRPETFAFGREWNSHIKSVNPNSFTVGETWFEGCYTGKINTLVATSAKYVYSGYSIGFQFNIAYGIQDALNLENKINIIEPVEAAMTYYPFLQFGIFHSNHDTYDMCNGNYSQLRLKDRLTNSKDNKAMLAAAFLLTSPGVPFIYYGDEIGESGGYARKPMQWNNISNAGFTSGIPWEPVANDYAVYNVASETTDSNSFLSLHKKLISIRLQETALRRGGYKTVQTNVPAVYAFMRTYADQVIFVILNLSSSTQSNVSLSINGTNIQDGTYNLKNLFTSSQQSAPLTVTGGNIVNWKPFFSILANQFYILKLDGIMVGEKSLSTSNEKKLMLTPNPVTNGSLTVELSGIEKSRVVELTILDIQGRILLKKETKGNSIFSINTEVFRSGMYFISIKGTDLLITKKFIIP